MSHTVALGKLNMDTVIYHELILHTPSCCCKYSLWYQIHINQQLKMVPTSIINLFSFMSCLLIKNSFRKLPNFFLKVKLHIWALFSGGGAERHKVGQSENSERRTSLVYFFHGICLLKEKNRMNLTYPFNSWSYFKHGSVNIPCNVECWWYFNLF